MATHPTGFPGRYERSLTLGCALSIVAIAVCCAVIILDLLAQVVRKSPPTLAKGSNPRSSFALQKIAVRELTFLGGHDVNNDDGILYEVPSWRDLSGDGTADQNGENHFPVCYTRGSIVRVAASFRVSHIEDGRKVRVVGLANAGLRFESNASVRGARLVIASVQSDHALPDEVRFYDPFRIDWRVSWDGGSSWVSAGATENRLYATLAEPQSKPLYETLLDIGCRNACGKSDAPSLIGEIWDDFQKRNADGTLPGVRRKMVDGFNRPDGKWMRYWFEEDNPLNQKVSQQCHRLRDMLQPFPEKPAFNGVGTCQAWTDLFEQTLRAQGITPIEIVKVNPARGNGLIGVGFLMKTRAFWTKFSGPLGIVGN